MTANDMRAILKEVEVPEFEFEIIERTQLEDRGNVIDPDDLETRPLLFLRGHYREPNIVTGDIEDQYTGRWLMSEYMVKSEVVQRAFLCYLTSLEHQAREHFKYKGRRVFGPHFDVDALWAICRHESLDYRGKE